jgi:hypothetical protein
VDVFLRHPGLKLSGAGLIVFILSALSLIVAPHIVGIIGMLAGGMGVWSGFIWTLFSWYVPSPPPEER